MRVGKKPDLSDWNLPYVFDEEKTFNDMLQDAIEQAVDIIFEDEDEKAYIYFPIQWGESDGNGGPKVADPLTIYLTLDSVNAVYSFNLRESLADSIEICAQDGSFSNQLPKLSSALRDLADEIDAAVKKSKELS